ncbi:MAG: ABC transporter permease [Acidimicrobiia bacterium]|nr:ABC transporter permease [Acidimicrobiia bacterium]
MKRITGAVVPLGAAFLAFLFGAAMILALGGSPFDGLTALIDGAFGTGDRVAATAVRATPLLLVGAGITIAFRASVINIGGEGQIIAGALLSTALALAIPGTPKLVLIPLVILAGLVGGGIWGAIPGVLKAYASVNEILSTVMLNIVAVQLMNYLLRGPMIDPVEVNGSRIPQTERLTDNAALPNLVDGSRLHLGVPLAVVAAVLVYIILFRTPLGFRLRAVGHNPDAARAAGISVERNIVGAMSMSGALCGLAGVALVFGSESLRLVTDGGAAGFTGSAGFNGIVAALFGGLHPLWTIPSSFLFGSLLTGATELQRQLQIPNALAIALNGLIVLFVVSSDPVRRWLNERLDRHARNDAETSA